MAKRRGRKRDLKAKRRQTTREGRGLIAFPTPEQVAKKAALLNFRITDSRDVRKLMQQAADTPLEVLYARGLLKSKRYSGRELYDAGRAYARLYYRKIGMPFQTSRDRPTRIEDPDDDARAEAEYTRQHAVLWAMPNKKYQAFATVVVELDWPEWLGKLLMERKEGWEYEALLDGLETLKDLKKG